MFAQDSVLSCVDAPLHPSEEPFQALGSLQTQLSRNLAACFCAISLGSLDKLCAAQLKTNSQSTLCSPRSFTWRIGPVCFSHPKPFSTSQRRLRLRAYPGRRVVLRARGEG